MIRTIRYTLLLTATFLLFCPVRVTGSYTANNEYILIINAYAEATVWSNNIISVVINTASKEGLSVYTEHMNVLIWQNISSLEDFKKKMYEKYNMHQPKLIIVLDNPTFLLNDEIKEIWNDIPMIFCAEKDYVAPEEVYLQNRSASVEERISLESILTNYNFTFFHYRVYIKENIELMRRMIPSMNKLIFIGDQRQINQQHNWEISQFLEKKHSDLDYQFLSAEYLSADQLMDSLNAIDKETTGILFSSWYHKETTDGNTLLMSNTHKVFTSNASAPIFALHYPDIIEGGMVGGYVFDQLEFEERLSETISTILAGVQPRDIPFYFPENHYPFFNYPALLLKKLSPGLCPSDSVFYEKPRSFFKEYKLLLIAIPIILLAIALFFFQQLRIIMLKKVKAAQQREINSIEDYMDLVNNMPILYIRGRVISDEANNPIDLLILNVNDSFKKTISLDTIIGKKVSDIVETSFQDLIHFLKIVTREKKAISYPYYSKKNDTYYEVVLTGTKGSKGVVDLFCLDSTKLHQTQLTLRSVNHKLAMALDVSNIVPWKWDLKEKTITYDISKSIRKNNTNREELAEQITIPEDEFFEQVYEEDRDLMLLAHKNLLEGRIAISQAEYRVVLYENGTPHMEWIEARATIDKKDENGDPLIIIGSLLIITNRKAMEQELIAAKVHAEESNRLKSAFLANMSHEIRTPLNAIVGFSSILANAEGEEEKQEYINIIESNNNLLLQLINDILDLSKIESGALEFIFSDFDLNKFLEEIAEPLKLKTSEDVELIFEPSQEVCIIHTEKTRLAQIMSNLLTNALKFTSKGTIKFGYRLEENNMIRFYVTDTGIGIAPEKQKEIFDRFVKLDPFSQGVGLGLHICQMIAHKLGGEIGVDSKEGEGSTFWFTIPFVRALTSGDKEKIIIPLKQKATILIAEDYENNYQLLENILRHEYHIIHAWNGKEAVELFKEYSPHLVLMDINMPVMNGYDAAKEIRKISRNIPIIAVTAYSSIEREVAESGFNSYMKQPVDAKVLKSEISTILRKMYK